MLLPVLDFPHLLSEILGNSLPDVWSRVYWIWPEGRNISNMANTTAEKFQIKYRTQKSVRWGDFMAIYRMESLYRSDIVDLFELVFRYMDWKSHVD